MSKEIRSKFNCTDKMQLLEKILLIEKTKIGRDTYCHIEESVFLCREKQYKCCSKMGNEKANLIRSGCAKLKRMFSH